MEDKHEKVEKKKNETPPSLHISYVASQAQDFV
jgi:hypothetical protein